MRLRHRGRTAAPPERVWQALGDPARWPEFMITLKKVRGVHGPARDDQRLLGISRSPLGIPIPIDVVAAVANERLVLRVHSLPGVTEQTAFVLTPSTRGGTDISVSTEVEGLFALPALPGVWTALEVTTRMLALRAARSVQADRSAGAA